MGALLKLVSPVRKTRYEYREVVAVLPPFYLKMLEIDKEKYANTKLDLYNWLVEQAGFHLDASCSSVLRFLVARTFRYHKQAELVSIRQMQEGLWDTKSDKALCCPVIKDERTARKALTMLERAGFITRYRTTINNVDTLSLVQVHSDAILSVEHTKRDEIMLRTRRKDREIYLQEVPETDENALEPSELRHLQKCTPRPLQKCSSEYKNKESNKNLSCSEPRNAKRVTRSRKLEIDCNDTALTAIDKAVARITERRESKVRRAAAPGAGFISLTDLNATWQSVMIETFGSCTFSGLTHTEYGIFKRIAKAHTLSGTWREFLLWTVQNWSLINKESRELDAYKKKKSGDWSLADDEKILLGSSSPDIFRMSRNYVKLLKRFSQHTLAGRTARPDESAEIIELRKVVAQVKKESAVSNQLLQKALSVKPMTVPIPKEVRAVKIVNPNNDTFFADTDSSLPEWK